MEIFRSKRVNIRDLLVGSTKTLRINVLSGLVLIAIAVVAWVQVEPLDVGTLRYFGPGMLPRALSMVLFVAGLIILIGGIFQREGAAEYFRASIRGPVMIMAALMVFAATIRGVETGSLSIPQLGLVVAGPLAVLIAGYASPEANFRDLAALAFGLTAGCAAVFNDILGLAIPILPAGIETPLSEWIGWDMAPRAAYALYGLVAALILVFLPGTGSKPATETTVETRAEAKANGRTD